MAEITSLGGIFVYILVISRVYKSTSESLPISFKMLIKWMESLLYDLERGTRGQ